MKTIPVIRIGLMILLVTTVHAQVGKVFRKIAPGVRILEYPPGGSNIGLIAIGSDEFIVDVSSFSSGERALGFRQWGAKKIRYSFETDETSGGHFDATDPDMMLDSLLGRIRFPNIDSFAVPDGTSAIREGQALEFDYLFSQNASTSMQPFTQGGGAFQGKATIKHLPDVGVNFIWTVPSVTIHLTDDALTFGSDDFATGVVEMILNDAGGTDRFGTMLLSTETESA